MPIRSSSSPSLAPTRLSLSGSVPSENARKQLRELSRRLFAAPGFDDRLELASGAPKGWNEAVNAALRALSRLDSGKIAISGLAVTIEGRGAGQGYGRRDLLPAQARPAGAVLLLRKHQLEGGGVLAAMPRKIVPRINADHQDRRPALEERTGSLPLDTRNRRARATTLSRSPRRNRRSLRLFPARSAPAHAPGPARSGAQIGMALDHGLERVGAQQVRIRAANDEHRNLPERNELRPQIGLRAAQIDRAERPREPAVIALRRTCRCARRTPPARSPPIARR